MRIAFPKFTGMGALAVATCLLVLTAIGSAMFALAHYIPFSDDDLGVKVRLDDQIKNARRIYDSTIPFVEIIVAVQEVNPKERTVSATGTSARKPVIIMIIFAAALRRLLKRLSH